MLPGVRACVMLDGHLDLPDLPLLLARTSQSPSGMSFRHEFTQDPLGRIKGIARSLRGVARL